MLKLIIADDEPLIRRGLREKVDWNSLGYEIAGEASNGLEALNLAKSVDPDVMLVDMKMPVMDGIKLLEALSANGLRAKVIVISAYSSFNYTHAAVKCGAFDYILKPIDADELTDVLNKIKMVLESDYKQISSKADVQILQEAIPLFKEKFLNSFLTSSVVDKSTLRDRLQKLGFPLDCKNYICLAIKVPELTGIIKNIFYDDHDKAFLSITNLIQGIITNKGFMATTFRNPLYVLDFFVIVGFTGSTSEILKMSENLKNDIENFLTVGIIISVGSVCSSFDQISSSFTKALEALNYHGMVNENCIIFSDDIKNSDRTSIVYSSENESAFMTSLEICNWEEMESNIRHFFDYIRGHENISFRQVYKLCSELLFLCDRILRKYDGSIESIFNEDITSIDYIACKGSLPHLEQWFSEVIARIMQFIMNKRSTNMGNVIDDIKSYIEGHCSEDITLNDMSQKFFINKSYLSALFKKRTGQTFIDYLTVFRMQKAAKILSNNQCKIYEVAQLVGYTDERYFSKLFKKQHGLTPEEYRKVNRG